MNPKSNSDPLEEALYKTKQINNYDFTKMLEEFEQEEKKDQTKLFKEANKRWQKTLEKMRMKKEKQIQHKLEEIKENVERKKITANNLLEKNKTEQDLKKKERLEKSLDAEEKLKKKLSHHFETLEDERKQIETYIREKMQMFTTNYKKDYESKKEEKIGRNSKSFQAFSTNLYKLENENNIIAEKKFEEKMGKYQKIYFRLKEYQIEKEEKLTNKNTKTVNKLKLKEIEEKKRKDYKGKILEHLTLVENRRSVAIEKNALRIKEFLLKEEKKFERNFKKKNDILKENGEISALLLERQAHIIEKASLKDSTVYLNKLNAHENTILNQLELKKKLNTFYSELSWLKDQSIVKKSKEVRKKLYFEMKRQEVEKAKEIEEKKKQEELAN